MEPEFIEAIARREVEKLKDDPAFIRHVTRVINNSGATGDNAVEIVHREAGGWIRTAIIVAEHLRWYSLKPNLTEVIQ